MLRQLLLAAIGASYCLQGGSAQDENFGERVEHIVAYMTDKAENCIGPALEGGSPSQHAGEMRIRSRSLSRRACPCETTMDLLSERVLRC